MYSYNDFERLFVRYKPEGIPASVSIEKVKSSYLLLRGRFRGTGCIETYPG